MPTFYNGIRLASTTISAAPRAPQAHEGKGCWFVAFRTAQAYNLNRQTKRRRSFQAIRKAWLEVVAQQSAAFSPALVWCQGGRFVLRQLAGMKNAGRISIELDACYARLHGLTRSELRHIPDPKDEFSDYSQVKRSEC